MRSRRLSTCCRKFWASSVCRLQATRRITDSEIAEKRGNNGFIYRFLVFKPVFVVQSYRKKPGYPRLTGHRQFLPTWRPFRRFSRLATERRRQCLYLWFLIHTKAFHKQLVLVRAAFLCGPFFLLAQHHKNENSLYYII